MSELGVEGTEFSSRCGKLYNQYNKLADMIIDSIRNDESVCIGVCVKDDALLFTKTMFESMVDKVLIELGLYAAASIGWTGNDFCFVIDHGSGNIKIEIKINVLGAEENL